MGHYPYATLGANGWLCYDRLHHPGFPTLLHDVLHHFGFMGTPAYRGCLYREFGRGHCEVYVDIPTHPSDPSLMACFPTAIGDDLSSTLERAAHRAHIQLCERHLTDLAGTAVGLLPIWDVGNREWTERPTVA
jgi:hypothetical protein